MLLTSFLFSKKLVRLLSKLSPDNISKASYFHFLIILAILAYLEHFSLLNNFSSKSAFIQQSLS